MEKERKSFLQRLKGLSKKTKIIIVTIVITVIIAVVGLIMFCTNNDNSFTANFMIKNIITIEELTDFLKQLEYGNYIQDDSVKLGPIIDFNYNNYNKLVSYSCTYHNNNVTMNEGGLILINEGTKEYKIIAQPVETSAIIYDLNTKNQSDQLKEIMNLLSLYFTENGVDSFALIRESDSDTLDKYAELGKNIGTIIGIKEARIIIDNKYMTNLKYNNGDTSDGLLLYSRMEIFPMYLGVTMTETEYAWDSTGLPESALGLLTSEEKTTMAMVYGPAYKQVEKYAILKMNTKLDDPTVGKYSSKESAKSALKLEEATDEPIIETEESKEIASMKQRVSFLDSYYDLNFTPTDEQMQEIIEVSNTADNFDNDALLEFILEKGWATTSGTETLDNSSSVTSNNNSSSSNNKNTNKNSNNNNTSTYEEIKATLSINIKDLINNSTDPEVETILQSNTLQVSIFIDGSLERSKSQMYYGGINSIPNIITQEFTFDITNKESIKSNVKIVIDNTSTMIRESTLYDKAITFDKTGTYTIK